MMKELAAQLGFYAGQFNYSLCHTLRPDSRYKDAAETGLHATLWMAECFGWKVETKRVELFNKSYYAAFKVTDGKNTAYYWCTSCNEVVDELTYKAYKEMNEGGVNNG